MARRVALLAILAVAVAAVHSAAAAECDSWQDVCALAPGVSASIGGSNTLLIPSGGYQYFALTITMEQVESVTAALSVYFGDPDIFVGINRQPTRQDWDYSSQSTGFQDVVVIPKTAFKTGKNVINILVWGAPTLLNNSLYRLVATVVAVPVVLQVGQIQTGAVIAGGASYYVFSTGNAAPQPMTVILTAFSGDPDIYISKTYHHPDITHAEWAGVAVGGDAITIPASDHPTNTTYYFGVIGYEASSFSIVVTMESTLTLQDGIPTAGSILRGQSQFYALQVGQFTNTNSDITVSITPSVGTVSVYITSQAQGAANNPPVLFPPHYSWNGMARWYSPLQLALHPADAGYLKGAGQYNLLIYGNLASNYTLTVTSSAAVLRLQDGQAQGEDVAAGQYEYFVFSANSTSDIDIAVTPFYGDPDLFVGCTLNPTFTDAGAPSRLVQHYVWASASSSGSDVVSVLQSDANRLPCVSAVDGTITLYMAVYGFRNSSFSIVASQDTGVPTTLVDGQPQRGSVYKHRYRQYRIYVGGDHQDITISLTSLSGDSDMYITTDGTMPSSTHNVAKSTSNSGRDSITLHSHVAPWCFNCFVRIAVWGYTQSDYIISATTSQAFRTLQDGVPVRDVVPAHVYEYFYMDVPQAGGTLTVTLTSFSGDADLFVSMLHEHPGITTMFNHTWFSMHIGNQLDRVVIPNAVSGRYYMSVRGFTNSSFSILAHDTVNGGSGIVTLFPGIPQSGSVAQGGWAYYQIAVGAPAVGLSFTVTPTSGLVSMYINPCAGEASDKCDGSNGGVDNRPKVVPPATTPTGQWSTTNSLSQQAIFIPADDDHLCTSCTLIIGVWGLAPSNFSVVAVPAGDTMQLQQGIPQRDYVGSGAFRFYTFTLGERDQDVVFEVTAITGDPDLYVSVCGTTIHGEPISPCITHPELNNATWFGLSLRDDRVVVNAGSAKSCVPTAMQLCHFYIGVNGFGGPSSFSLVAYLHDDTPVLLVDGQPQSGHVNQSITNTYQFDLNPGHTYLAIVVTPLSGDPDLYVALDNARPDQNHWQYRSTSISGAETVIIQYNDGVYGHYCQPTWPCRVYMSVVGFHASDYTIVATSGIAATSLQSGVPSRGYAPPGIYAYYVLPVQVPNVELDIIVTPISGDPDLYVATAPNTRPTSAFGHNTWRSARLGGDVLTIYTKDDPHACKAPCNYYIGVAGFGGASDFTIMARVGSGTPIGLVDGQPQVGALNRSMTDQYQFMLQPSQSSVNIILTPTFGDADLFVTVDGQTPTTSHFQYASVASSGSDSVMVAVGQPAWTKYCDNGQPCPVRIAVVAFSQCQYNLVASTANATTVLLPSQPVEDTVTTGTYQYYVYRATAATASFTVVLTPVSGDPDIYISASTPRPTSAPTEHTWASVRVGADAIDITAGEPGTCTPPCNYYIGVTGFFGDATYTIMARNHSGQPITLVDGRPQVGFVELSTYQRYLVTMLPGMQILQVSLSPAFGDPDMFISLGGDIPNRSKADFKSFSSSGQDLITINASTALYQTKCAGQHACPVNIAVYGFTIASYTITAASLDGITLLRDGVPLRDNVGAAQYQYYMYQVSTVGLPLTFTLTPLSGDPDMFIATYPHPTSAAKNHTWASQRINQDIITIQPNDPHACIVPCRYYIGVLGFAGGASYQILASAVNVNLPVTLVPGAPSRGHVPYQQFRFYTLQIGPTASDVTAHLTALSGSSVAVFVVPNYIGNAAQLPTWTCLAHHNDGSGHSICVQWGVINYKWTSLGSSSNTLTISGTEAGSCINCLYLFAVASVDGNAAGADFSIQATMAGSLVTLQDGVPLKDSVVQGQYNYYRLVLTTPRSDVLITCTSFSGDADLYVSATITHPNKNPGQWSWRSFSLSNDQVLIQYQSLADCEAALETGGTCVLYIAAYGYSNATYSIMGTTDTSFNTPQTLLVGVPQVGFVNQSAYRYYAAQVRVPEGTPFTVTLSPFFGDPDLYVTTDGSEPGTHHYCKSSTHVGGTVQDSVTILPTDSCYCTDCVLNAAVYGFRQSQYTMTFQSGGDLTHLVDGTASPGYTSAGGYAYFSLYVSNPYADVTFSVTTQSGSPALYVSCMNMSNPEQMPSTSNYRWIGTSDGAGIIVIKHTDAKSCAPGIFMVAVYSQSTAVFTIAGTTSTPGDDRLLPLVDGVPQRNVVGQLNYKFYTFDARSNPETAITIRVSEQIGRVDLFVTNLYVPGENANQGELPTRESSVWSTNRFSSSSTRSSITILPTDPNWSLSKTLYTIGVYGESTSVFVISASSGSVTETLLLGTPSPNHLVKAGNVQRFVLNVPPTSDPVFIGTTPLAGQSVLLVSATNPNPYCTQGATTSCGNYTWISQDTSGAVISIPTQYTTNGIILYIGVYGISDTTYTISAWSSMHTQLFDGSPQQSATSNTEVCIAWTNSGQCARQQPAQAAYFQFDIAPASISSPGDIAITVTQPCNTNPTLTCSNLEVFVYICQTCTAADSYPSAAMNQFLQLATGPSSTLFIPRQQAAALCTDPTNVCHYYVGVYSLCENCASVMFQIGFSTMAPQMIANSCMDGHWCDQPQGLLVGGQSKQYEIFLGDTPSSLHVRLEACVGTPVLYMCNKGCANPYMPGPGNADYTAHTSGNGRAAIDVSPASGVFYVTVNGTSPTSSANAPWSYELMVSSGDNVPELIQGTADIDSVGSDSVQLSWSVPSLSGGNSAATNVQYMLYKAEGGFPTGAITTTACGLAAFAPGGANAPMDVGYPQSMTVSGLNPSTKYQFAVVAICDSSCSGDSSTTLHAAYPVVTITTNKAGLSAGAVVGIILAVILIPAIIVVVYLYRRRQRMEKTVQYDSHELTDFDAIMSQPVSGYAPLLQDEDARSQPQASGSLASRLTSKLR